MNCLDNIWLVSLVILKFGNDFFCLVIPWKCHQCIGRQNKAWIACPLQRLQADKITSGFPWRKQVSFCVYQSFYYSILIYSVEYLC